jgi:Family of unknown function (DUF6941)
MQLNFGILCDQVRKEDNGKLLFIGVYTADITVPHFPANTVLALAVSITPSQVGREKFDLVVSLNGQLLVSGSSEFDVADVKPSFLAFQNIPVQLSAPGHLEFKVSCGGKSLTAWQGDAALA